jgi:uncharacterized protein (DUF169 family)
MTTKSQNFAVLDKFNFERQPVAVKFAIAKPEGIKRIDKELNMCEMLWEAQESDPFYVTPDDWVCVGIEQVIIGLQDPEPVLVSGIFGGEEGLFKGDNACRAMYQDIPALPKGSVQYVVFSAIDKLTFDPDVLVITANLPQAQTILRSMNYSTGKPFISKATPVIACSWIYVYPVVSGELNYFVTGLGLGMQKMDVFPPGLFLISVPFQILPVVLENLGDMDYSPELESGPGGEAHRKRVDQFKKDMIKKIEEK